MVSALAGCLLACSAHAADPGAAVTSSTAAAARPRVGLVLAGGGAKGGAHVGVLKVLEEMHVPIDCIAGTSMGALVGGGYASGIPAAALEKFVTGIDWKSVVGGVGRRDLQTIEQKRAGVTYSNEFEFGLQDKRIMLPAGIVNTSNIEDLLRSYVAPSRAQADFDKLPIPYRAVATDMVSGKMVVLKEGDLATAMRASMAIPGAFAPVMTEQYILSDGGMVRNIPVDVARDLCADVVIVVNLVEEEVKREKLQTATQLLQPQHRRHDRRQREPAAGVADRARHPHRRDHGRHHDGRLRARARDGAARREGRAQDGCATARRWPCRRPSTRRGAPASPPARTSRPGSPTCKYKGMERVNPEYLQATRAGEAGRHRRHGRDQRRGPAHVGPAGIRVGRIPADRRPRQSRRWNGGRRKSAGDRITSSSTWASTGRRTATWASSSTPSTPARGLNSLGAEWRNEVQLGYFNNLSTSFYQPLDVAQRFFVEPKLFWTRSWEDVFVDNERLARYKFSDRGGKFDVGVNLSDDAQIRGGLPVHAPGRRVETGSPILPEATRNDAGLTMAATYDSRDTPSTRRAASRPRWSTPTSTTRWAVTSTGNASNSGSAWLCRCAATSSG